ncbi:hypothetical protein, variant 3 [Aphanomyces astaci]|uniref:PDZ domain-containing protein n=1 Tax=Aphanomyces astaci TaxID=112090 RepID=W4H3X3_APHAT|nr:hypothetical protein, variant 4 [Aphanomyces astaci]XP_009824769.1 hypothetical protein, variant 5 [Aphanomyces astaci]XP_009824770.1 hypothetical protein, variant 2 [Aphanomyces astaci]XP_009824771.1 hypothetical protein, variant 3 [Aphanomyces astaci]ETV86296.1 hypothetical protein, variant 2 [Aphanomyces astaci]ETV86297.1 hypothetical protein, variant 3 [Aphanomyces astaci]ETV86298.1 hypothetical protein, variant 4 [Aphanomyces astaci]ETV86299.1 hypothetical protein, variant 5 [Aphanom|eukprot:XP_009824768.1 hypothetical protein, variant 4 [Aphanomyces astaci]
MAFSPTVMSPRRSGQAQSTLLPPLLTRLIRFTEGDRVKTSFGTGIFRHKIKGVNGRPVYVVDMDAGGVLHSQTCWMMPRLPSLTGNEIPPGLPVQTPSNRPAIVVGYNVLDKVYEVQYDDDGSRESLESKYVRLAARTRCRTKFGLGVVTQYRHDDGFYVVLLDSNATAFLKASSVSAVDLRLLGKIPKPLSADQILAEFNGRLTQQQADALAAAGENAYLTVRAYCEKNASSLSSIASTFNYGADYTAALGSFVNPEFHDATEKVRQAGERELQRLMELSDLVKTRVGTKLATNAELVELTAHSKKILNCVGSCIEMRQVAEQLAKQLQAGAQSEDGAALIAHFKTMLQARVEQQQRRMRMLKPDQFLNDLEQTLSPRGLKSKGKALMNELATKDMALACMDPLEMLERVESFLPCVTEQATVFINESEVMLAKFQASKQGRSILAKAKELAQVTDDNPALLREKVTEAVSKLKVNELAKWGRTLAVDAAARQEFVDQVKDRCLDFLMSVLPSIEVDPIIGTKDDIEYTLSHLDLSKFKVRKEKVSVKLGVATDDDVLTMKATHLSAIIPGLNWTFVQKKFPYLNGGGTADAEVLGGCVSLGFRAEKVAMADGTWQPTLAVSSIEIEIKEDLTLQINGSWFSTVYNVLASVFKDLIKDYIASTLEGSLIDHVVSLVTVLNAFMKEYWPMLLQLLHVTVEELPLASAWRGAKPLAPPMPHEEDLTFTSSNLPIVLAKRTRDRMALVSGVTLPNLKTSTLTDTQRHELYRIPLQATIVGVNGLSCAKLTSKEVATLLETLAAPVQLRFATAVPDDNFQVKPRRMLRTFDVSFGDGPLGLKLRARPLATHGVIVAGFIPDRSGGHDEAEASSSLPAMGQGEASGQIRPGQLLLRANGIDVRAMAFPVVRTV